MRVWICGVDVTCLFSGAATLWVVLMPRTWGGASAAADVAVLSGRPRGRMEYFESAKCGAGASARYSSVVLPSRAWPNESRAWLVIALTAENSWPKKAVNCCQPATRLCSIADVVLGGGLLRPWARAWGVAEKTMSTSVKAKKAFSAACRRLNAFSWRLVWLLR